MIRTILSALSLSFAAPASAQSFSCRIGTNPACLDYGDTSCSSLGKCVDNNAMCFDRYQCDYRGFTCRSNLEECADEHDALITRHNRLVDEYNELLEMSRDLESQLTRARRVIVDMALSQECVLGATTLEDAQSCF